LNHRAIINAGAAARALVFYDAASAFANFNLEFTGFAFNGIQVCVSDQFNVQMPADLDQYR
jgi:hypothetical protein